MLRLALRTLPLFAVIVGFAMALGAYMNYSGVRGAYLDLIRDRMQMVATDVGTVIESAVSVGIPPAEQVTLPTLLARQAEADPIIRAIHVVAPDGRLLFSSEPEADAPQPGDAGEVLTIERPALNDFGVEVARLVIFYDRSASDARVEGFGRAILADALPAGLIAVLAGSLAAFLVLTRLHRRASRAAAGRDDAISTADRDMDEITGERGAVT